MILEYFCTADGIIHLKQRRYKSFFFFPQKYQSALTRSCLDLCFTCVAPHLFWCCVTVALDAFADT